MEVGTLTSDGAVVDCSAMFAQLEERARIRLLSTLTCRVAKLLGEARLAGAGASSCRRTGSGTAGHVGTMCPQAALSTSTILDIFEGTQQIQQLIVGRRLLGKASAELE